MTHLFEGHLLRVAEASLSNLPNMAGTGRVIGRVKVAKRSKLRRFLFLFTLRAVQGEVRVQQGDILERSCKIALFTFDYANSVTRIMTSKVI